MISEFISARRPTAFTNGVVANTIQYGPARSLLANMAREGNAASRDHDRMINEIENMFSEASVNLGLPEGIESFVDWPEYLDSGTLGFDLEETFPSFQAGWL